MQPINFKFHWNLLSSTWAQNFSPCDTDSCSPFIFFVNHNLNDPVSACKRTYEACHRVNLLYSWAVPLLETCIRFLEMWGGRRWTCKHATCTHFSPAHSTTLALFHATQMSTVLPLVRSNTQSNIDSIEEQPSVRVKSCLVLEDAIQNFDSMSEGGRFRLFTPAGAGGNFRCHGEYIEPLALVVTMDCNGNVIAGFN